VFIVRGGGLPSIRRHQPTGFEMAIKTVLDMFANRVAESGASAALRSKSEGSWKTQTWGEVDALSSRIAAGLLAEGIEVGDRVSILGGSRKEWFWSDVGILKAGAVTVPIYPSNPSKDCAYILNDSGSRIVFADDPHQVEKMIEARAELPGVKRVIYFDTVATLDKPDHAGRTRVTLEEVLPEDAAGWVISLDELLTAGDGLDGADEALKACADKVTPESTCTFVYTSGTTGPPKGVVLTHDNFVFECEVARSALALASDDEQLLFLPLAHIFAKLLMFASVAQGNVTSFAEGIPQVVANCAEVRPTFMGSVPRIYEKVYTKVVSGAERAGGLKKAIFDWSVGVGTKVSALRQAGEEPSGLLALQYSLATKLVFSKLHALFGRRLKFFISGGAPLSKEIAEFFHAAGILVLEGYGLTETTGATHINRQGSYRFGTVGQPFDGVEMRIAKDGEILVRGRNVLKEYHGKPEATADAIDSDGWFHTGDIGEEDDGGFLRITDRKKDLIVTAGGKNVAPQNIENALKLSCFVSQVMVHGDKRKFLSALVTLDEESITQWAGAEGIKWKDLADLTQHPKVFELIEGELGTLNAGLASYETIKRFAILEQDLSEENGELTPTLKVKRKAVTQRYQSLLDSFYGEKHA
jgi:long-chain acyl-CoA synthetase